MGSQDTVGSCRVGRRRDGADKSSHQADRRVGSGIDDIDAKVVTVGQVELLKYWIEKTNVKAPLLFRLSGGVGGCVAGPAHVFVVVVVRGAGIPGRGTAGLHRLTILNPVKR